MTARKEQVSQVRVLSPVALQSVVSEQSQHSGVWTALEQTLLARCPGSLTPIPMDSLAPPCYPSPHPYPCLFNDLSNRLSVTGYPSSVRSAWLSTVEAAMPLNRSRSLPKLGFPSREPSELFLHCRAARRVGLESPERQGLQLPTCFSFSSSPVSAL